jgi:hypothetical protein
MNIQCIMSRLETDQKAFARYKVMRAMRIDCQLRIADEKFVKTISPLDRARSRGGADRYYGRKFAPSVLVGYAGKVRPAYSPKEIAAYKEGWENETDRKEW